MTDYALCSDCFQDQGLRLDAELIGISDQSPCPRCSRTAGRKLTKDIVGGLAHRFFVWGTLFRFDYGAAPLVQFNTHQKTSIDISDWLISDLQLIEWILYQPSEGMTHGDGFSGVI